jgi:predicted dehydrogenase
MPKKVRVGVVGTSWFADLMHLPSLKSAPGAKVVAICGRGRERAEAMAHKYDIPQVFTDYRAMIERAGLEALVVVTPDDLHYPITMAALEAGIHVFCEKPLAMSAAQAREMHQKAGTAGVKHLVNFTYRWVPFHRYLHDLVAEGYLGRLYQIDARVLAGYGRGTGYSWRFDGRHGLGILGDLGSHLIDLVRWIAGDIASVSSCLKAFVSHDGDGNEPAVPTNDAVAMTVELAGGVVGTLEVSAVAHIPEAANSQYLAFYGEAGTLEARFSLSGAELRGVRAGESEWTPMPVPAHYLEGGDPNGPVMDVLQQVFSRQPASARLFIEAIRGNHQPEPSFADGVRVQEVIDAALVSHREGRRVRLAVDPTAPLQRQQSG